MDSTLQLANTRSAESFSAFKAAVGSSVYFHDTSCCLTLPFLCSSPSPADCHSVTQLDLAWAHMELAKPLGISYTPSGTSQPSTSLWCGTALECCSPLHSGSKLYRSVAWAHVELAKPLL